MNSSQFMDKQILGLSGSQNNDIFELLNSQEDHHGAKKDEILPSYDFQPIRPLAASSGSIGNLDGGSRVWSSSPAKTNTSGLRATSSLEPHESAKFTLEKDNGVYDTALLAEIDRTMKKHTDDILHALDTVSSRLSQLETRSHCLEDSMDDLKVSVGNNNGSNDGKLRQLENVLREIQTGVQVLRDKQEIAEAHSKLAKLQATSNVDKKTENPATVPEDHFQQSTSPSQQSLQPTPPSSVIQQPSALPIYNSNAQPSHQVIQQPSPHPVHAPNAPPPPQAVQQSPVPVHAPLPPPQQNQPPVQVGSQLSSNPVSIAQSLAREHYYPSPSLPPEPTLQHQLPAQQSQPTPQNYPASSQPPYHSQPGHLPQQHQPHGPMASQLQPPLSHNPEESPYISQTTSYPFNSRPVGSLQPTGSPPAAQFYGPNAHMYEPSGSRPSSGQLPISPGYGPSSGPNYGDAYPYSGSSHYSSNNSLMKPPPHSSVPSSTPDGSSYSRLPTAQILPHALPTATSVGNGSSSGGTGNRVPIDDVVDKVATMGFSREQVKATVRKLTENGQSVDLNVVLDKLMNDSEIQPQKGWFGR